MILVNAQLKSRKLIELSIPEAQLRTIIFTCVYQPPPQPRIPFVEHCLEIKLLSPRSNRWICVGDFNDTPCEQLLLDNEAFPGLSIVAAQNPDNQEFLPTRWSGNRCIDYIITSCSSIITSISLSGEAISDHKILCANFTLDGHGSREFPHRFQRTPDLSKPDEVPINAWIYLCTQFELKRIQSQCCLCLWNKKMLTSLGIV